MYTDFVIIASLEHTTSRCDGWIRIETWFSNMSLFPFLVGSICLDSSNSISYSITYNFCFYCDYVTSCHPPKTLLKARQIRDLSVFAKVTNCPNQLQPLIVKLTPSYDQPLHRLQYLQTLRKLLSGQWASFAARDATQSRSQSIIRWVDKARQLSDLGPISSDSNNDGVGSFFLYCHRLYRKMNGEYRYL